MNPMIGPIRPSSTAFTDEQRLAAVTAPVHDPLWFLARQFQTGAFIADDAGSPVTVTISHSTAPLTIDGQPVTGPLEPDIEAEPTPPADRVDTATRIRLATELFRRCADAGLGPYAVAALRTGLAQEHPLHAIRANGPAATIAAHLPDPVALYTAWSAVVGANGTSGTLPSLPGAGSAQDTAEHVARGWVAWMTRHVSAVGAPAAPPHWDDSSLAYTFRTQAQLGSDGVILTAQKYDGSGLDWDSFDRSALAKAPLAGQLTSVRPSRVTFPGMPERGYWTLEDGTVNLDVLAAQDPARQLLARFAYSYTNDWFVVPLRVEPGATVITSLTVTDSFGTVTSVPAAATLDGPAARFQLWELDLDPSGSDVGRGLRVFLPSAPQGLQSRPVEDVVLARDEMANLGWLVELTTTDDDGRLVDRYRRWLARRTEGDLSFRRDDGGARYYRLGTTVPDFWYPLESVTTGENTVLQLASVPPSATDVSSEGVRGVLLPHTANTFVSDEEVSRTGTRVVRVDRLTYTSSGHRVWRARFRGPGVGEASSGLRFDTIGPPAADQHRSR